MSPRIDFREIPETLEKSLPVDEEDIESTVRDLCPGSEPHSSGHYRTVGGYDPEKRPCGGRPVVDGQRDVPVGIPQGGSESRQAERRKSAKFFSPRAYFFYDLSADAGLTFVDEVAFDEPVVAVFKFGPADVDSPNRTSGDRIALVLQALRPVEALSEAMARAGADEPELEAGIQGILPVEEPVDGFLERPVAPDDKEEVDSGRRGPPCGGGRVERTARDEERKIAADPASDRVEEFGLTAAGRPGGRGGVDDDMDFRPGHFDVPDSAHFIFNIAGHGPEVVRELLKYRQEFMNFDQGSNFLPGQGIVVAKMVDMIQSKRTQGTGREPSTDGYAQAEKKSPKSNRPDDMTRVLADRGGRFLEFDDDLDLLFKRELRQLAAPLSFLLKDRFRRFILHGSHVRIS